MDSLEICLKKIKKGAKRLSCSVHLPRIGFGTPSFNWYGAERLIRKLISNKGIEAWIYYYRRRKKRCRSNSDSSDDVKTKKLSLDMNDYRIFFYKVEEKRRIELTKSLVHVNADIHASLEDSTTHVLVDKYDKDSLIKQLDGFDDCIVVKIDWIEQCLQQDTILDIPESLRVS